MGGKHGIVLPTLCQKSIEMLDGNDPRRKAPRHLFFGARPLARKQLALGSEKKLRLGSYRFSQGSYGWIYNMYTYIYIGKL